MADPSKDKTPPAKPLPVPSSYSADHDTEASRGRETESTEQSRAESTARLASPVPTHSRSTNTPPISHSTGQTYPNRIGSSDAQTPLETYEDGGPSSGPGHSALAAALQGQFGRSPPRFSTPPLRPLSPHQAGDALREHLSQSQYGSYDTRSVQGAYGGPTVGPSGLENPDVVKRHLVQPGDSGDGSSETGPSRHYDGSRKLSHRSSQQNTGAGMDEDEFSSLRLQGGDMTREVYRWAEDMDEQGRPRNQRSRSFYISRPEPESEVTDISTIKVPGGFRRDYLRRAAESPAPSDHNYDRQRRNGGGGGNARSRPQMLTNNFIEFLTLYGHFAGEELEEDDEALGPDEYFSSALFDDRDRGFGDESDDDRDLNESTTLLTPRGTGKRPRRHRERVGPGKTTSWGAVLLLLKSFVGTGVLFLPKAFKNGGMIFSAVVLLAIAFLSYYCFILLVRCRLKIEKSFGDIGGELYGRWMRFIILFSIVLSQIGFTSAYIVFTSENLQAFVEAVSKCKTFIDIKYMIIMQLALFLPLSLIRDISKLGATALIADACILLGLIYLYYYNIYTISSNHGVADIKLFNPYDWTLFIGTAVFTFEGVGLIIPIQESMQRPQRFPPILGGVMIIITIIFVSMGALAYAAFGSKTQTVIILNLPQGDKFVNAVQFLYSVAILLSTPLQLFPAIRITENELFTKSGKYNPYIKWQKNAFRAGLVLMCSLLAWGGAGDLDKFVALVGSVACIPLVNVYPPLLHLRAVAHTRAQRILDIGLAIFGMCLMIVTTTLTIHNWSTSNASKGPSYCARK